MSKEEQEAIEYLKEDIELYEDCCYLTTDDHMKSIEILLNYISKLQKELEQEKEKNIELAEELQIAKGGIKIANLDMVDNNFISKDKR